MDKPADLEDRLVDFAVRIINVTWFNFVDSWVTSCRFFSAPKGNAVKDMLALAEGLIHRSLGQRPRK